MAQKITKLVALFLMVWLAGCTSSPPISSLTGSERRTIAEMVVLKPGAIPRESYQILGTVEGTACKHNLYAHGLSNMDEARQGVRIRAAKLGANALINMVCEEKTMGNGGLHCRQIVVCVADAINVYDKSLLTPLTDALEQ